MSQKRQAEELEGEKPSEAKLNQGKGKDPTLIFGRAKVPCVDPIK